MTTESLNRPPEHHVKVLDGQGWIGIINTMGSEVTAVNAARVSFGKIKTEMDNRDVELLKYLIAHKHASPLEHIQFTFVVHCPLFIRSQWHRHRTWKYNEISRRYTSVDMELYNPTQIRQQAKSDRQASEAQTNEIWNQENATIIAKANTAAVEVYNQLLENGVAREQARGVLPQNMMTTFWATVDLANLIKFLDLRDDAHAQWEIRQYAQGIKQLLKKDFTTIAEVAGW
jgi:thymidylate synthase (FAD)